MRRKLQLPGRWVRRRLTIPLALLVGAAALLWWPRPLHSDNFVFYLPNNNEVLPIRTIGRTSYLPLVRTLNLVGKVDALKEGRKKLEIWFGNTKLEFNSGSGKIRVDRTTLTLQQAVRVEEGQWLVPVEFLSLVLPRIVRSSIEYRPGDHRIFIGGIKPSTFSVRLDPIPNGARLMLAFTEPVTLQTAARNEKWILYLGSRAVQPLEQKFEFNNAYVRDLQFDDQDGVPKLILTPGGSGMDLYPALEEGGKILRADVVKPEPPVAGQEAATLATGPAPATGTESVQPGTQGSLPPLSSTSSLPVIVLDAGHGGSDLGAQGPNGVVEKNLVALLVIRVRTALLATQKYRVILTRPGDSNPDFDQRATIADTARAAVFFSFHAGNLGFRSPRAVVYTYSSPSPLPSAEPAPRPLLTLWKEAQADHGAESRRLSQTLQGEFSRLPGLVASKPEEAPVRILRSIDAPAAAIEIGSLAPEVDASPLVGTEFQQNLSAAIVRAVEAFRKGPS